MRNLWIGCAFATFLLGTTTSHSKTVWQTDNGQITSITGDLLISGVYPHLTTYSHARENGIYGYGDECGIGAIAVWGGKLYMVNYAAHQPKGSDHKLYILDNKKQMTIFPGSVGGTPAARMIHQESNQLLIGHYLIDKNGTIRTIPILTMPGRISAIARHLKDPANKVYYYDMEGMLYEANIHTLEVKKLYHNPLPGWHGKGGYTAQGKLILANNGEDEGFEVDKDWQVPVAGQRGGEKRGTLAEYDGKGFRIIERKQFTDVTTRHGINAVPDEKSPLWSMGWDNRSIRLKVLENGTWSTYLLPKAANNNDPSHGWFTEWPRIREIGTNQMMMDMHGMFYDFPATFSTGNSAGIRPIASHLRYIPDFCSWNGQIILATDESSIQGNPLTGQPQSNLWFGTKRDFADWGPATGYGAIWLQDTVAKGQLSDPYLLAGFDNRIAHMVNHDKWPLTFTIQIDKKGNGSWTDYKNITLAAGAYDSYIFPKSLKGEWLRIQLANDGFVTFALHYTTDRYKDAAKFSSMFEAIADIDTKQEVLTAKLFTNRCNFNLSCYTTVTKEGKQLLKGEYEFEKLNFDFKPGIVDSLASRALKMNSGNSEVWSVDAASVILHTSKGNLRLPKGNPLFDSYTTGRTVRELESEREIANIHGTFYELPLFYIGQEPLYEMMRPISSHAKMIDDFNTWNGLLVISGVNKSAQSGEHLFKNKSGDAALWFGSIDDLWKLGKPIGQGGPWKNTAVQKEVMSDPYLMTGYDKKTLTLSADRDVKVTLWITIAHYTDQKVAYKQFALKSGVPVKYTFPKGFSAHWAAFSTDTDCTATAQFLYE